MTTTFITVRAYIKDLKGFSSALYAKNVFVSPADDAIIIIEWQYTDDTPEWERDNIINDINQYLEQVRYGNYHERRYVGVKEVAYNFNVDFEN